MTTTFECGLIFAICLTSVLSQSINVEGYYWRDYAGEVPNDALAGGTDYNGNPIYMGQIFHDGRMSPAKIYPKNNKAYYGWDGKEQSGTQFIKILCSQYPEKFHWINTKHDEIHLLANYHLIIGGHHPEKTMYFGRVHFRMETSVGKVSTGTTQNLGLYITQNGEEFNFRSFEILSYNNTDDEPPEPPLYIPDTPSKPGS